MAARVYEIAMGFVLAMSLVLLYGCAEDDDRSIAVHCFDEQAQNASFGAFVNTRCPNVNDPQ